MPVQGAAATPKRKQREQGGQRPAGSGDALTAAVAAVQPRGISSPSGKKGRTRQRRSLRPAPSQQQKPHPGPLPRLLPEAWPVLQRSVCRQGEVLEGRHHASLAGRRGLLVVAAPVQLLPLCHCFLRLACVGCPAHRCSSCMAEAKGGWRDSHTQAVTRADRAHA